MNAREPIEGSMEQLRAIFHPHEMLLLNQFQITQGLPRFILMPFSDKFIYWYSDVLDLLTENQTTYSDEIEIAIYGRLVGRDDSKIDPMLLDLLQLKERHELLRLDDGKHVTHEEVETAFWTRRNVLAYIASLVVSGEIDKEAASGNGDSQEAG